MAERKSGSGVIIGFVGLVVLTAAALAFWIISAGKKADTTVPTGPEEGFVVDENGALVPYRTGGSNTGGQEDGQEPEVLDDELTAEERVAEAAAAARELVGGEPIPCESPCDCPQGQACQQGSQLCLPSPFPVYCCEKDGCPEGSPCVFTEGGFGVCGD